MTHPASMAPSIRPRQKALALFMSALLPGFGQLYNGELNKALWLFLGFAFLSVPAVALIALHLPSGLMAPALALGLLLTLALWLGGMWDAWRTAARRQDHVPAGWQLSGVYVLVFVLCDLLALPMLVAHVGSQEVSSFRIPADSMAPGILRGDILFADRRYNRPGGVTAVRRGDVAIFTYPNDRTLYYIKRVVALPGDTVKIVGHEVWVNGQSLTQAVQDEGGRLLVTEAIDGLRWQVQWGGGPRPTAAPVELTVPPGHAFVLGDQRDTAVDGRRFGPVPLSDIVGKARQVWFSHGPDGVRWSRIGLVVGR